MSNFKSVFCSPLRTKETISAAGITLKEAVEFLSKDDENYQHCGASYIQHNTFVSDTAKEEVLYLVFAHKLL